MDAEKSRPVAYHFDRFTLDLARGALLAADGTELPLRPKSLALLQLFVEHAGRLLDRDAIMQAVWPDVFVTDDSITQCVGEIRRVLGDETQRLLRTLPRRGYCFVAEVAREVSEADSTSARLLPAREQAESARTSTAIGAERRQLTVLFCDLVGSTALAECMDPEDLGEVIRAYQARCAAAIVRFGGHVAKHLGDGVLAYFGYPYAHEDAAERAVRTGLALVEALDDLRPGPDLTLQVRVGIATGLVVSDLTGTGGPGEITVGKPLNLAARLQAIAETGTVIIAEGTRQLVGELFALENLGRQLLKGFTAPVQVWRVTGEGTAESRFAALRGANLTPLVGRRQELTLLLDRWEQAKEGEGQVVLLAGEAGIGKSRLTQALRDRLAGEPHACLGYHSSPYRRDSPLQPVITQLEHAANFIRSDDPGERLAKLEALLVQGRADIARVAPLIASLLMISGEGRYPPLDLSPQLQRERTLAVLVDQLAGLASRQPVLLVWEDVHWADPTSLELLGLAIDRLQSLPVLALVTYRPEFAPPWPGHTHVTWLTLNCLSRRRCGRLVAGLTGGKPLPTVILDQIVAKAEGVPLFVEELTKAVVESGLLREEGARYELKGPLSPLAVPATLHDSLMARLDRLAPVKEIAQIAAVIGREFSYELLVAVTGEEEGKLADALQQLAVAELVFRCGTSSPAVYIFKHALVRDAAYGSLLKGRRQQLHTRIAQVLENHFPQAVEAEPEILAHHWAKAGIGGKAAAYHARAGKHALARSATSEAVAQLTMGLEALQGLPEDHERLRLELDLQVALGAALVAAKGSAAPEPARTYTRAAELCRQLGEQGHLVPVLFGLWASHSVRDELGAARKVAAELLGLAEQRDDGAAEILGRRTLGATLFMLGEFTACRAHLEKLLALHCFTTGSSTAYAYPFDPNISGQAYLSATLLLLGYPEQALSQAGESLAKADRLAHHNTLVMVLHSQCVLDQLVHDLHGLETHTETMSTVAGKQGFALFSAMAAIFRGWILVEGGELAAGIARMQRGLAAYQATGAATHKPYFLGLIVEALLRAGDASQGQKLVTKALDRIAHTDARYFEAELHRLEGELQLVPSHRDPAGAEAAFRRAIEVARGQEAKLWELRAATSLARLWAGQGKRQKAYDLLAPVHGWFTEGFATEDLVEAGRLLRSLGEQPSSH